MIVALYHRHDGTVHQVQITGADIERKTVRVLAEADIFPHYSMGGPMDLPRGTVFRDQLTDIQVVADLEEARQNWIAAIEDVDHLEAADFPQVNLDAAYLRECECAQVFLSVAELPY